MSERISFHRMSRQLASQTTQVIRVSGEVYDLLSDIRAQTGLTTVTIMDKLMNFIAPLIVMEEPDNYKPFKSGADLWKQK